MKTLKIVLIGLTLAVSFTSCSQNKVYNVSSLMSGNEVVISSENLIKGDTVRIGYDIGGREIGSKDMHGSYIGHIAIVQ